MGSGGKINHTVANVKRFLRFQQGQHTAYGLLVDDTVHELAGSLFDTARETGHTFLLNEVQCLAPCQPTKILGIGLNYKSHLGGRKPPGKPEVFVVPPSAMLDPEDAIVIPEGTRQCEYEGEMVMVIGRRARHIPVDRAADCIFGVTCGNDVSARDWQKNDLQWWRAKGCDTFAPFGPIIAQGLNYRDLLLTTRVNRHMKQQQRTSDLIFTPEKLVSFISQHMTLFPGDVIFTGTPGNTSPMMPGDEVEVELEDVGVLRNPVKQA